MSPEQPFLRLSASIASGAAEHALRVAAAEVSLACVIGTERYELSSHRNGFSADTPVDVSCVAKNVTALLFAHAVGEGHTSYEESVESFVGPGYVDPSLKMYHLLNNTHGLDGSLLQLCPYKVDGTIDADKILATVRDTVPTSSPGEFFYYYGSEGSWLAAAILEKIYDTTFTELARARLLGNFCTHSHLARITKVCPAYGG